MVASRRKSPVRRPKSRRNAPRAAVGNEVEARELELYIDNTRKHYDRKREAEMALLKKVRSGRYNHALAPKMFMYVVTDAAKAYGREHGSGDDGLRIFNPATRMMVAKSFVESFEGESEFRDAKAAARAPKARKRPAAKRNAGPRMTMADIKQRNKSYHRSKDQDFSYFDRKTSKFFGGDKFSGPYSGEGGTFFVQKNKAGINIKRALPSGEIRGMHHDEEGFYGYRTVEDARDAAKRMAKGR